MQTFEDYLKDVHAEDYHGTDDDMGDNFESWLVDDLQLDELISYAQTWGELQVDLFKADIRKDLEKIGAILKS